MSFRSRSNPLSHGVVDVETARRAIATVARERDALAQQLQQAQTVVDTLRRQLAARTAEATDLSRALRAVEAQTSSPEALEKARAREDEATRLLSRTQSQLDDTRGRLAAVSHERDEAVAEQARLEAALRATRAELQELGTACPDEARAQRLASDLANLRRHQDEAIERGVRAQTDRLLLEVSSVRDSVLRALRSLPGAGGPWHDGLLAVLARIDSVFEREGVVPIGSPGELFDPRLHEAIGNAQGAEGTVVETVSSGLARADGSVLSPAQVLVGGAQ